MARTREVEEMWGEEAIEWKATWFAELVGRAVGAKR